METSKTPLADEISAYIAHRIRGTAYWGETPFDVAAATQLGFQFWQGGSPAEIGVPLPSYFRHVLNLYPWGGYDVPGGVEMRLLKLADGSRVPDDAVMEDLAAWVFSAVNQGPTLVHCQVGLNRSALVAGLVLVRHYGMAPVDAIAMLRKERGPAVLCNPAFEQWLLRQ